MTAICSAISQAIWRLPHSVQTSKTQKQAIPPTPYGHIGEGLSNRKVRILYINGIRNTRTDVEESASLIHAIAHATIEFCHTTLGWFDAYFTTRRVQQAALDSAKRIHELLEHDKGEDRELLVITHSAGGLVFKEATSQLSEEEKKHISLMTFASTYIFPKECGLKKVINVLNTKDFFPEPSRLLRHTGGEVIRVSPAKTSLSLWERIREHDFAASTYQSALQKLLKGQQELCAIQ